MARRKHATYGSQSNTELHSGMSGSGGRASAAQVSRRGLGGRRDTPYRVAGTTAGSWSTQVSNNTSRIFRDER